MVAGIIGGILFAGVALNSFTVVSVGEEASVSSFGKVKEGMILEGFNIIPPWYTIDEYNLQERTSTYEDLGVASQDKFKTSMDVNFTGSFLRGTADKNRKNTGVSSTYLDTHVYKRVLSCLTKAGGQVKNSQAFFNEDTQTTLASSTLDCVNTYLETVGGYKLTSVQFSDIRLDPKVKGFMVKTKERQEEENQALSSLAIADTEAQKVVKTSAAKLLAAENDKQSRMKAAEAALYEVKKQAEGNLALSKSLTPELINYTKIKQWDGVQPKVISGEGGSLLLSIK